MKKTSAKKLKINCKKINNAKDNIVVVPGSASWAYSKTLKINKKKYDYRIFIMSYIHILKEKIETAIMIVYTSYPKI